MAEKGKAPSKNHKWDAKKGKWVLKSFEERQKGRNILLQGKNNPIRVIHDSIRNANAAKEVRRLSSQKANPSKEEPKKNNLKTKGPNIKSVGTVDFNVDTESGKKAYNKALAASKSTGAKTDKDKDKSTTEALHGERNRAEARKRRLRPKPGSAGARIQQSLKDGGHTQEGLDNITERHQAWLAAKKSGTLGDWEKKYHPDRTPQYTNKNKSTPKPTTQKPEPKKSKLKFSDPLPEKKKKKKKKNNNNPIGKQFGG